MSVFRIIIIIKIVTCWCFGYFEKLVLENFHHHL